MSNRYECLKSNNYIKFSAYFAETTNFAVLPTNQLYIAFVFSILLRTYLYLDYCYVESAFTCFSVGETIKRSRGHNICGCN